MQESICLIVPCYNEARRLTLDAFRVAGVQVVFVDDGSRDGTSDLIRNGLTDAMTLLHLPRHVGKPEAVRQGMRHAMSLPAWQAAAWVGFWDADMATPLSQLSVLLECARRAATPVDAVWGSRVARLGCAITRSVARHTIGRTFATLAAAVLGVHAYDTQCGAKLFRKDAATIAFADPFVCTCVFDVELLYRLAGRRIVECPLTEWHDVPGSITRLLGAMLRGVHDILRLRLRYGRLDEVLRRTAP